MPNLELTAPIGMDEGGPSPLPLTFGYDVGSSAAVPGGATLTNIELVLRSCLAAGDVHRAATILGRPFSIRGQVVEGDKRGRVLGFPTANVSLDLANAAPADGVYAGWLRRTDIDHAWPAAISVGTNPTFKGRRDRRVESFVLDRDDLDLYGVEVEVMFDWRLRGMVAFSSVGDLLAQMRSDVSRTRWLVGNRSPGATTSASATSGTPED